MSHDGLKYRERTSARVKCPASQVSLVSYISLTSGFAGEFAVFDDRAGCRVAVLPGAGEPGGEFRAVAVLRVPLPGTP